MSKRLVSEKNEKNSFFQVDLGKNLDLKIWPFIKRPQLTDTYFITFRLTTLHRVDELTTTVHAERCMYSPVMNKYFIVT